MSFSHARIPESSYKRNVRAELLDPIFHLENKQAHYKPTQKSTEDRLIYGVY